MLILIHYCLAEHYEVVEISYNLNLILWFKMLFNVLLTSHQFLRTQNL